MITTKFTTIKRQLMLLVLSGMLPIFLFSVAVVSYVALQKQRALESSMINTARALSSAVEGQLDRIQSSLELLISIGDFKQSNLKDLHNRLTVFVDKQKEWSSIGLTDTDGNILFNTIRPYGTKLLNVKGQAHWDEALATGKPALSGFRIGTVTGVKNFAFAMPVKVDGQLRYMLIATINAKFLAEILNRQKLPPEWTATLLDKNGIIMARNIYHDKFSGQKASDYLLNKIKTGETFFETVNKENHKQYGTSTSLARGWKLYLGMPFEMSVLPAQSILWFLIIGGSTLLALAVLLSIIVSGKIARPIIALADSAKRIGKGGKAERVETNLFEINEVAVALQNASIERDLSDEKAHQAITLRDNFLSVASHELKTPLTTINLQAQRLSRLVRNPELITTDKLNQSSKAVSTQVKRLTRLIDDLLDISRITAGKLDVYKEQLDLALLTKEVISHFEEVAGRAKITIQHDESVQGYFDRNRMEQVITNLISNALKYGDGKPIEVFVTTADGKANLSVKDNGIGIDKKDHAKIFERFERLVNDNEISGLGLGLWIVHRIVTQLEGEIIVASEGLGQGSTFTVTIPLK